jgi:hypothetical protein
MQKVVLCNRVHPQLILEVALPAFVMDTFFFFLIFQVSQLFEQAVPLKLEMVLPLLAVH